MENLSIKWINEKKSYAFVKPKQTLWWHEQTDGYKIKIDLVIWISKNEWELRLGVHAY